MSASLSSSKKRQIRVRNNIKKRNKGQRPRISVFRSNKNIYIQLIGIDGNVIQSFSSVVIDEKELQSRLAQNSEKKDIQSILPYHKAV